MNFDSYTYKLRYPMGSAHVVKETKIAYRAETTRLREKFKNDLFDDLGISDHPKRERLFELAQERGDGNGLEYVYNAALDLLDLIDF
jgi:hypothetical protein